MFAYTVALEANEVHGHRDGAVTVPVQGLDVIQQIGKELVPSLQNTQGHDVMASHFIHNFPGQSLCPGVRRERRTGERGGRMEGEGGREGRDRLFIYYRQRQFSFAPHPAATDVVTETKLPR